MPFVKRHRTYYKYGTEPDATVVGSPTIDNGVVSGFSSANYLSLPELFRPASNPWERVICFTTSNDVTTVQQLIYINYASDSIAGVHFHINSGKIAAQISSNGSSWNIVGSFLGKTTLSTNTTYYAMIRFTGSEYQLLLSTTGEFNGEETLENSITSSTPIYQSNTVYDRLGFRSSSLPQVFTGSMDLTKCYGKINGQDWWHGTKAVEGDKNDYAYYEDSNKLYQLARRKRFYYKDGVEVPSNTITDFGRTVYYKNIVTTKYWKEITTGGRELEYACYAPIGASWYWYAKAPIGSDMIWYSHSKGAGTKASSPSDLVDGGFDYSSITEDFATTLGITTPRSYENDLYKDTTVTETVEGTPEDYTYTTEEVVPVEVTADEEYDYSEFIPSAQFDNYEDRLTSYSPALKGLLNYYRYEKQRDTGTYTFTLDENTEASLLFVGNGGGGCSSQKDSQWHYSGGGSGACFEGVVRLPADTYTLTIGSLGYGNNRDNVHYHSSSVVSTDSYLTNSAGVELIRVGAGGNGYTSVGGVSGAAGVLTMGTLDVVETKKARNGNTQVGKTASTNYSLSAYDGTASGYGAGTGAERGEGNVYGVKGIFKLGIITKKEGIRSY